MNNLQCAIYNFNNRRETGFTLLEILIAMGIAAVAGVLLLVIIVNSAGMFSKQSSKVTTGLNSNDALSKVRGIIKQANAISSQYLQGSVTYTTGPTQLVLQVYSIDSSGNLISDTSDYFIFSLDQGILRMKVFPDPASFRAAADEVISTNVDNLKFQYLNSSVPEEEVVPVSADRIRMTLVLKQRMGQDSEISTATSEANLRND